MSDRRRISGASKASPSAKRMASLLLLLMTVGCHGSAPSPPTDTSSAESPIADVPASQQRVVEASEFDAEWPLTPWSGTLGCKDGAVVFRTGDTVYALNERARQLGLPSVEPVWPVPSPGPARDPLRRILQDDRMRIFRAVVACEQRRQLVAACIDEVRTARGLSVADLQQIETEGREQFWPPLTRTRKSLTKLIEAGLRLCNP